MDDLNIFISQIPDFYLIPASSKIDYFALYLETKEAKETFLANEINDCFKKLKIQEYSNTNAYLLSNSKRNKKPTKYLKVKNGYHLEGSFKNSMSQKIGSIPEPEPSKNLFPLELLDNTRGYLQKVGKQAVICYDIQQYDAAFVMIRKLLEILIIECFEKHKLSNSIKDKNGDFFYLSDLISHLLSEPTWNITRNTRQSIPKIKKFADLSAHNRRFIAVKSDIDLIRDELRITLEELLHLVDYVNWK
jgi:hypothetical protein